MAVYVGFVSHCGAFEVDVIRVEVHSGVYMITYTCVHQMCGCVLA